MADHFTVYAPFPTLPDRGLLAQLAPGATITEGSPTVIAWRDVSVSINTMPGAQLMEHLQGLLGYVKANGGTTALAVRVLHTVGVFGCTIEPAFDRLAGNKAFALCSQLTAASSGFAFFGATIYDGHGRDLLKEGLVRPSAHDVARRAEVLLACAVRGLLEDDAGTEHEPDAEALRKEVHAWIDADPARQAACERDELAFLATPIAQAQPQERIDRIWAAEAACTMLWALGVKELPAFTVSEHPYQLAKLVGVRGEPTLLAPMLRSDDELEAMRVRLTAIHWRLVDHRLHPTKPVDFVAISEKKDGWLPPFTVEGLPIVEHDLAIGGLPLSRVEDSSLARSIARERQRGILWVLGVHPQFSSVDAPT